MIVVEEGGGLFRDELVEAGIFVPTGTDGLYGRSATYESVVAGVDALADRVAESEGTISYRFPPVMPRQVLERTGYLSSFPDLIGSVSTFTGDNDDHKRLMDVAQAGGEWTNLLNDAGASLCPAICHPLYPTLRGAQPAGGTRYDVSGWCYRHEPSIDPARMQAFRQHDLVFVGGSTEAREHRDRWLELGAEIFTELGLVVETVVANDPFFGRAGRILATNQRAETLKYEIVTRIDSVDNPTAIASSNCHLDHFGEPFGITTVDGEVAHSCCFGFGLDRITLALLRTHGTDPRTWPTPIRKKLWP